MKCEHGYDIRKHPIDLKLSGPDGAVVASMCLSEGVRPVFEMVTAGGWKIKATAEHKFIVVENDDVVWKSLSDIQPNDFVVIRRPEREWATSYRRMATPVIKATPSGGFEMKTDRSVPEYMSDELAWFTGYLIGDGCIPKDGRPCLHVAVKDRSREKLIAAVCNLFGMKLAIHATTTTTKMQHGWIHSRLAREFMVQSVGVDPDDKLRIPLEIWRAPKSALKAFIDGLFIADGYFQASGDNYVTTISRELAWDVAHAMLMLGMGCPYVIELDKEGSTTGYVYRVGVFRNDRIPTSRSIYKSSKSGKWFWRTRDGAGDVGIRRRTLIGSGLQHSLLKDGWHYVQVKSITACSAESVYDLTVPSVEAFVANGFIAHNCGGRNSPMLRRIRVRSTENIVSEMVHLYSNYGYTGMMLYDDELNVNKNLVGLMDSILMAQRELGTNWQLRGFIKSNLFTDAQAHAMAQAGFRWILIGFESGSPRILENIQKKATREQNSECMAIARRHGLKVKALMSVGHAGESRETIQETKDWLLQEKPDDFDCTVISTYCGTPYFDEAVETAPGIWTYTAPRTGDRLHSYEIDYNTTADLYKGKLDDGYKSYVYTDHLTSEEIVTLRDELERSVRAELGIPFPTSAAAIQFEHSMGQAGRLPETILRSTRQEVAV